MASTLERIQKVTAELLGVPAAKAIESAKFVEDLGAESTQSIELVVSLEEEFGIEMDEAGALGVKTVGDAVKFIDAALAKK
ncbi:MAG: acyl carrier protein [bacterium]